MGFACLCHLERKIRTTRLLASTVSPAAVNQAVRALYSVIKNSKQYINFIANTSRTSLLQAVQPVPMYPLLQIDALRQVRTLILSRISSKQKPLFQN
jgi:hypothetical protein